MKVLAPSNKHANESKLEAFLKDPKAGRNEASKMIRNHSVDIALVTEKVLASITVCAGERIDIKT